MLEGLELPRTEIPQSIFVWNQTQFGLLAELRSERPVSTLLGCPSTTMFGIPIQEDKTLPDGVVEFRGRDGKLLLRVEGL
jgi:hypothetical protein